MEPAVKPAAAATVSGVVGVLATTGTLASSKFIELTNRYGNGIKLINMPCPGLVEQVERGDLESETTINLIKKYVSPLLEQMPILLFWVHTLPVSIPFD